jgi:hypothetical protein
MPEKKLGIVSFTVSPLCQSGIGIPTPSVRYRWSRISPVVPSYAQLASQVGAYASRKRMFQYEMSNVLP